MGSCFRNVWFLTVFSLFLVFATLEPLGCVAGGRENGPVVDSRLGKIRGKVQRAAQGTKVYAFNGVPFAEPPIGELRYRKPQPVKPWGKNVLDATKYPPSCMQANVFDPRDEVWIPYSREKSEDCLYLNVWTPTLDTSSRLPVMAYLHGGQFQGGSAAMQLSDGGVLAALGHVVVVTIAYRLQSYGFLYDGTEDAPGNQGLHDTRMALHWIQDNIASFGGDPAEVTLFGWSAGSITTGFHLLSQGSQTLFKRAIMQSGSATKKGRAREPSLMLKYTNDFAQIFGCSKNNSNESSASVSCLRNVNSSLIVAVEQTFVDEHNGMFEPIFGDAFLPVEPSKATFPGDKDVIIGYVANEGSIILYDELRDTFSQILPPRLINKAEMIHFMEILYTDLSLHDLIKLQQVYMGEIGDYDYDNLRQALVDIAGDEHYVCATYDIATRLVDAAASTKGGNSVYIYHMDYVSACNKRRHWFGMSHGDELPFVFGRPFDRNSGCAKDIPFSRTLIQLWTSFAKGRSPPGPNGIEWPPFLPESMAILNITRKGPSLASNKREARCSELKKLGLY